MGKYEEALADLTSVIALDEQNAWAIAARGETYRRMAKYHEAIADFTRAMGLKLADPMRFCLRGSTYIAINDIAAAELDLARAIKGPLNSALDYYGCGVALVLSNRYNEAMEMLGQAFKRDAATWILAETDDLLDPIRNLHEFQSLRDNTVPSWRK
jgi:tetratricopeptide (TPR) repeat protein